MRVIVYEMWDGSEETFVLNSLEEEYHERAHAEMEVHSRCTWVRGYRLNWV